MSADSCAIRIFALAVLREAVAFFTGSHSLARQWPSAGPALQNRPLFRGLRAAKARSRPLGRRRHAREMEVLLLVILCCPCVGATSLSDALPHSQTVPMQVMDGHDIRFAHLSTADGLSEMAVQQISQDDQGFMWFGTLDGLNRYDGYEFKVYKRGAPNAELGGTTITALFKDRSGQLWIGVDQYLDRFDPITEKLTEYRHDPKISTSLGGTVYAITQDREGQVWLATSTGLDKLNPATGIFSHFRHDDRDLTSLDAKGLQTDVRFVGVDNSDTLWVETSAGINSFDPKTGKATRFPQLLNHGESHVQYVYHDHSGRLWIHSREGSGVGTFNPKTGEVVRYKFPTGDPGTQTAERVTSVLEDERGILWFGTQGSGLLKLDPNHGTIVRYRNEPADPRSLSNNFVLCLYEDLEGNIWAGTGGGGINRFPAIPSGFTSYQKRPGERNGLDQNFVLSVFEDSDGILWVGNDGVLNRIDPKTGGFTFYRRRNGDSSISDGTVLSAVEDGAGTLWFATYRGGLNSFDGRTGRFKAYRHEPGDPNSLSSDVVMRLQLDPKGTIWVATDHALDEFDPRSKRFKHYPELNGSLSVGLVTCLVQDRRGMLWLGTNEAGLVRFDPATRRYEAYKNQPGNSAALSGNRVNALLVDAGGTLWVGTQLGLDRFDGATQQFHAYTERDALPSNAVEGILEDRQRNLWVGTDNGLAKFIPSTNSVRAYYASDGLAGSEFNYWGAPFQDTHGEMFFPGVNGLTAFYPDKIRDNSYVPPLVLTDFRLFNEPVPVGPHSLLKKGISYTDSLELSRAQSIFSFEFAALSYRAPAANRYRYRLEGLDQGWNLVSSKHRLVTYTTLPSGDYVFRVQGSNNQDVWNEKGTSVRIRVLPAWWSTWWFRTVAMAFMLLSVGSAYHFRLQNIHRQFNMRLEERVGERTRIARELHDTLLQSFHGLLLRFQAVSNLLPTRPDEAKQTLDSAIDQAAQAITDGRDAVEGLRSSIVVTNDLASAISTLGDELASGETNPNAAEFHVVVEGTPRDLHPIFRDEIYRIAGEALRNAFRHAQAQRIEVEIHYDEWQLRLRVRDDGKGIDPKLLNEDGRPGHFGLRGLRERAKLLGGKLTVWSELDSGTELELSVPAANAYSTNGPKRSWLAEKLSGKDKERKS